MSLQTLEITTKICEEMEEARDKAENQHDTLVGVVERYFQNKHGWKLRGRNCGVTQPRFHDLRYGIRHDLIMNTTRRNYGIEVLHNIPGTVYEAARQIERSETTGVDKLVLVVTKTCTSDFVKYCKDNGVFLYFATKRGGKRTLEPVVGIGTRFKLAQQEER